MKRGHTRNVLSPPIEGAAEPTFSTVPPRLLTALRTVKIRYAALKMLALVIRL
jgi:hypothetical protein